MTSQSLSLTIALEAVERVLDANTGDLRELAKIAGMEPEILFRRADLTGVDLRGQDIEFLLSLEVDYLGATLTDEQMRAFRNAERKLKASGLSPESINRRIELITDFIEEVTSNGPYYATRNDEPAELTKEFLFETLLQPVLDFDRRKLPLPAEFTNSVLADFSRWPETLTYRFFDELFLLLGALECPVDVAVVSTLVSYWEPTFQNDLGDLIAHLGTSTALDRYWLTKDSFQETYDAAVQIGRGHDVDVAAIEYHLTRWAQSGDVSWNDILNFFLNVPFNCDVDQSERLATFITRMDWHPGHTAEILGAAVPPKMKTAIFRQLLAQGREERVVEVVKWLENNQGAAGALTLENTFGQLKDFELAANLAFEISPRLADNQINVIYNTLHGLTKNTRDLDRLASFNRRFGKGKS